MAELRDQEVMLKAGREVGINETDLGGSQQYLTQIANVRYE